MTGKKMKINTCKQCGCVFMLTRYTGKKEYCTPECYKKSCLVSELMKT